MRNTTFLIPLKGFLALAIILLFSNQVSAHNNVSYISEEAIIILGSVSLITLLGFIFSIVGLFRESKWMRVISLIGAVISTLGAVFSLVRNGPLESFLIPLTLFCAANWIMILKGKNTPGNLRAKPIITGIWEGILISIICLITLWIGSRIIPDRIIARWVLIVIGIFIIIIVTSLGHRHLLLKRTELNLKTSFSTGVTATLSATLFCLLVVCIPFMVQYFSESYSLAPNNMISFLVLIIGPPLILGLIISFILFGKN